MTREQRKNHLALIRACSDPRKTPLKQWLSEQAARLQLSPFALYCRFHRHGWPGVRLCHLNSRVVFVTRANPPPWITAPAPLKPQARII